MPPKTLRAEKPCLKLTRVLAEVTHLTSPVRTFVTFTTFLLV
jgi:hypothetical protein